jgi:hypothetical protein
MSWSDSGQPQPAPNTPRGYGFFAAILNYVFGKHNALDTTVSAATSVATPATIAARDSNGRIGEGGLDVTMSQTTASGVIVTGIAGQTSTAYYEVVRDSALVAKRTLDYQGNQLHSGTVTAPAGFIGPVTGNVVGNVTGAVSGNAGGLAAPVGLSSALSDYKASTSASANAVTIAAGGAYTDSNGNVVGPLTAQTATLPTQPSGTTVQYVGISLVPTTGAPNTGTPAATLAALTIPVVNKPVCYVIQRGVTTNPSGIIAAADIIDVRNLGGGGAGSGGSGGAPASASYLVYGTPPGALPDALDASSGTANLFVHSNSIKEAVTDASRIDFLKAAVTGNLVGAIQSLGTGTLQIVIPANSPPVVVGLPGVTRELTATTAVSGTASGAAALYQVVADLRGTGPALTPTLTTAGATLFANETILATIWWNGTSFDFTSLYYPQFPLLNSSQYKLINVPQQSYGGTNSNVGTGGAAAAMVGSTPYTVILPRGQMRGDISIAGDWQQSASSATGMYALLFVDGTWYNAISVPNLQTVAAGPYAGFLFHCEVTGLTAGAHTLQPGYLNTAGAGTFGVPVQNLRMWGSFSG